MVVSHHQGSSGSLTLGSHSIELPLLSKTPTTYPGWLKYVCAECDVSYAINKCQFRHHGVPGCKHPSSPQITVLYPAPTKSTLGPTVTGFGQIGRIDPQFTCGNIIAIAKCPSCNKEKEVIKASCVKQPCPICWESWATKEKDRSLSRINGFASLFKSAKKGRCGNPKHFIFSLHADDIDPYIKEFGDIDGIIKMRSDLIKIMRKYGLMGGSIVYHPYRIKDEIKDQLRPITAISGKKFWALVRENVLKLPSWRDYVYFSPHFHTISFGWIEKSDVVYAETGWVYYNIGSLKKDEDISRCLFYMLSHAGVLPGKHSLTWYGSLSYNKMFIVEECVERVPVLCDYCGAQLVLIDVDAPDDDLPTLYYRVVVHRKYAFRPHQKRIIPKKKEKCPDDQSWAQKLIKRVDHLNLLADVRFKEVIGYAQPSWRY